MAQLSIMDSLMPYKFIIDTSSVLSQKDDEDHRRIVYKGLWDNIDRLINDKEIVSCSEAFAEIHDDSIREWATKVGLLILAIDDVIQLNVTEVVVKNPKLIDFKGYAPGKNGSSGDAFIIATAMKYNLTIITEEKENSPKKIPAACDIMGISHLNINELCIHEKWRF